MAASCAQPQNPALHDWLCSEISDRTGPTRSRSASGPTVAVCPARHDLKMPQRSESSRASSSLSGRVSQLALGRSALRQGCSASDVDRAYADLAQRAVGIDAGVGELDLLADQLDKLRARDRSYAPAFEVRCGVGVAVTPFAQRLERGGGAVAGLVLTPGRLGAGAIRRPRSLEHRPSNPRRDELIVRGAASRPRLDEPEPVAGGELVTQQLPALDPGQASDVVPGQLEQIKRDEVKLPGRGGVGLKRSSAHRCEVLDDCAVSRAERDKLGVEHRPARDRGERLQQRAEPVAQARTAA